MSYFPMCVQLKGKPVYVIGDGPQSQDKYEKLKPFGALLIRQQDFSEADAASKPVFVIVGDKGPEDAARIAALCAKAHIPVNVVDVPALCSFYFPALILRGDMTVAISSGGCSPAAAGCMRRSIEAAIPDATEQILSWLGENREFLKQRGLLKQAAEAAFAKNRPLSRQELLELP